VLQDHAWYRKGLPANVIKMNAECLNLRPHDHPGYQTIQVRAFCRVAQAQLAQRAIRQLLDTFAMFPLDLLSLYCVKISSRCLIIYAGGAMGNLRSLLRVDWEGWEEVDVLEEMSIGGRFLASKNSFERSWLPHGDVCLPFCRLCV